MNRKTKSFFPETSLSNNPTVIATAALAIDVIPMMLPVYRLAIFALINQVTERIRKDDPPERPTAIRVFIGK